MSEAPSPGSGTPAYTRDPVNTLDAIVVVGALLIIGGAVAALVFANIPKDNLAILASIVAGLAGTVIGGYAGYRWGASEALKRAQAASAP
jgi:uncharacterized membrane protein YeaQ/YmgE (transglycosylase-associated protein family)